MPNEKRKQEVIDAAIAAFVKAAEASGIKADVEVVRRTTERTYDGLNAITNELAEQFCPEGERELAKRAIYVACSATLNKLGNAATQTRHDILEAGKGSNMPKGLADAIIEKCVKFLGESLVDIAAISDMDGGKPITKEALRQARADRAADRARKHDIDLSDAVFVAGNASGGVLAVDLEGDAEDIMKKFASMDQAELKAMLIAQNPHDAKLREYLSNPAVHVDVAGVRPVEPGESLSPELLMAEHAALRAAKNPKGDC